MKIVSQTQDTMILKEGALTRIIFGVLFVVIGGMAIFFLLNIPGFISGGAIALTGLWLILYTHKTEIIISKSLNQILYKSKRFIGTKATTYVLSDAVSVDLRRGQAIAAGLQYFQATMLTELSLIVFKDGTELVLDDKKTSGHIADSFLVSGRDKKTITAKNIAEFIGIPFNDAPRNDAFFINLSKLTFLPHWLGGPKRTKN